MTLKVRSKTLSTCVFTWVKLLATIGKSFRSGGPAGGDGFGVVAGFEAHVERGDSVVVPGGGVGWAGHEELAAFVAEVVEDGMDVEGLSTGGRIERDVVAGARAGAAGERFAHEDVGLRVEGARGLVDLMGKLEGQARGCRCRRGGWGGR